MSYWESRKLVEQYKKALGKSYTIIPDELIMLEKQWNKLKLDLERKKKIKATDIQIADAVVALGEVEGRMVNLIRQLAAKP